MNAETGHERWRYAVGGEIWDGISPAVANGMVFASSKSGHFFALDAATGKARWRVTLETDYIASSPAVVGDTVYIATMRGVIFALAANDGKEIWRSTIKGAEQMHSSPAVIGGVIYVGDYENGHDGSLYALGDPLAPATPSATPGV